MKMIDDTGCAPEYRALIESKIPQAASTGMPIEAGELSPILKPHQRDIVRWAVAGGCRAVFAAFGLGKTLMQLEICRQILAKTQPGARALIVSPLGVKQEFTQDAAKLGTAVEYVRTDAEVADAGNLCITNYERVRDGQISPPTLAAFTVVTLDEASCLRSYGSKTYQEFLPLFADVRYRFVCTATPAPNRFKELIHYAGFLGVMDTGEALTRFFQRDSQKANNLTLYPHKEREFWLWMASWACFVSRPSDLGHDDTGYALPPLNIHWHEIEVDHSASVRVDRDGQQSLIRDASAGLPEMAAERRETVGDRVAKALEIIAAEPEKHFIIWHDREDERHAICKALPEAAAVYGSLDLDTREQRIIDFSDGRIQYLATKPRISGSGCNFQRHCADAVFVGIDYKFNDLIQAIHRVYRFLQTREVNIHIIYADSERNVRQTVEAKWQQHNELVAEMTAIIRRHGLGLVMLDALRRSIGVEREEACGERWTAVRNDCVAELPRLAANSVDLICTSIPFGNHYEYSASYHDFGHNLDNDAFFRQMDHLTPELLRVLKPGRVYACHVKDRVLFGNVTGYGMPSIDPFHAHTIAHCMRHGFVFFGMITIETDVVRENNQTYRLGWSEQCKDGSRMGVGCPEYLLLFRKLPTNTGKGYADDKVVKTKAEYTRGRWQIDARAKWNSSGNRLLTPDEIRALPLETVMTWYSAYMDGQVYDYEQHVAVADALDSEGHLPARFEALRVPARDIDRVWDDVSRMHTLNGDQSRKNLVHHICPLQFDIVDRVIRRFSNPGELVLDPFGGIMTVPYRALKMDRRGYGIELSADYYRDGLRYLRMAEAAATAPTLFDLPTPDAAEVPR